MLPRGSTLLGLAVGCLVLVLGMTPQASAAEFHVTNGTELESALLATADNGEDDVISVAAGPYYSIFFL